MAADDIELKRAPAPRRGDVVAIPFLDGRFFIDQVRGYEPREGWLVDLIRMESSTGGDEDFDDPRRSSICLHETYFEGRQWWTYDSRAEGSETDGPTATEGEVHS